VTGKSLIALDALAVAHRQGVIHRDLKPANVMLMKAGAKLLDFGLAKLRASSTAPAFAATSVATREPAAEKGIVFGTIPCMTPEQLEGKEADARSNIVHAADSSCFGSGA
jgi:serine/threonine-protein kinase